MAKRDEVLGLRLNAAELDALKALARAGSTFARVVAALSGEARGRTVGCPHPDGCRHMGGAQWTDRLRT